MQVIYDIIGSIIIGGIILLMLTSFNSSVMEGSAIQTFNSIVQSNMTQLTELIEYDFRKMGYRVGTIYDSAIVYADSNKILLRADIDNNGTVENIAYFLDPAKKSGHVNPRSRILYRQVNGAGAQTINLGITRFRMAYYNGADSLIAENPIKSPSQIRSIRLAINIESTSPYDTTYAGTTWERSITPKNLK
jgi:hypothetical protein